MSVGAGGEARVGVAEVLRDFVQRAALVEEQGRTGMAEVVAAEVGNVRALERRVPGAGEMPLVEMIAALPPVPVIGAINGPAIGAGLGSNLSSWPSSPNSG